MSIPSRLRPSQSTILRTFGSIVSTRVSCCDATQSLGSGALFHTRCTISVNAGCLATAGKMAQREFTYPGVMHPRRVHTAANRSKRRSLHRLSPLRPHPPLIRAHTVELQQSYYSCGRAAVSAVLSAVREMSAKECLRLCKSLAAHLLGP